VSKHVIVLVVAALCLTGCSNQASVSDSKASAATSTSSGGSKFDSGPRAGEQAIDESLVKSGEQLFKDKGCSACHTFGRRLSGPDLAGVTMRRTGQWMENQILHPEVMTRQDPISHQLLGVYALQMPNQGLTPEQAKSVIEFLKHRDHEASGEAAEAGHGAEKEGD